MTLRYINPANDAGFNASGISTVQIQVPSGQYWLPRLIKIGLLGNPGQLNIRPFIPRLITQLYHGTPTDTSPGALIDSTVNTASGDVTAILNGTMLQPGEWLTAITRTLNLDVWTQGLVYLEFDGLTTGDLIEATQYLANTTPGQSFRGQLAYPMAMPPMPDRTFESVFFNPGQNNTINLFGLSTGPNLFIYNVSMEGLTTPAVTGADSALQPIPPTSPPGVIVDKFAYYDPYTANASISFAQDYHGYQMLPGGVQFIQIGPAAVNTSAFAVNIGYRFMSI
jgi:hypothetical protein